MNVQFGGNFSTEISLLLDEVLKNLSPMSGWCFNWKNEAEHPEEELSSAQYSDIKKADAPKWKIVPL